MIHDAQAQDGCSRDSDDSRSGADGLTRVRGRLESPVTRSYRDLVAERREMDRPGPWTVRLLASRRVR